MRQVAIIRRDYTYDTIDTYNIGDFPYYELNTKCLVCRDKNPKEYVYDFYGNVITNKDGSAIITRVKHSINSIEEFEFWKDNNFNNPVYMSR